MSLDLGTLPDFLLLLKSLGVLQKFELCFEFVYLLLFHAKLFLVVAGFTPIDMLLHNFLDVGRMADDGKAPMLRLTDRDKEIFLRKQVHIFRPLKKVKRVIDLPASHLRSYFGITFADPRRTGLH
jgi:hypothetical protein